MKNFKLAVAQIPSVKGDIRANTASHLEAVCRACDKDVSLLVFPELSLTGYEPDLASALAFDSPDPRLSELTEAAQKHNIFLIVGAPLKKAGLPAIGSIIISPEGKITTYSKIHLHPGEEVFFSSGRDHCFIEVEGKRVAVAVCADTNSSHHAKYCAENGADIYVAGVLIGEGGYASDTETLKNHAADHKMLVAMANHSLPTGGWKPAGRSAVWDHSGLLAAAGKDHRYLVIAEDSPEGWLGEVVEI